jgi:hypothetical protein
MTEEYMPRWEGDRIGHGVGDAIWIAPAVQTLLDALSQSTWIAEDPDNHLLPHLRGTIDDASSPWSFLSADVHDDVYILALEWNRPQGRLRNLRADTFALLGTIAESATYIHQRIDGETVIYDVATGMLPGDSHFAPHGHAMQIRIGGQEVSRMVVEMRPGPAHMTGGLPPFW